MRALRATLSVLVLCTSSQAALPRGDLAGRRLELLPTAAPTCVFPSFTGTLRIEVRNQGADTAIASQGLVFEDLDGDGLLSGGDLIHRHFDVPAIPPCERLAVEVPLDLPLSFQGSPLHVLLDSRSVVSEILETNNLVDALDGCRERGPIDYTLREEWRYEPANPSVDCQSRNVTTAAIVAQTSDDNADLIIDDRDDPDLIFIQQRSPFVDVLQILDGPTGLVRATIDATAVGLRILPDATPAVADLDDDGVPEIVVSARRLADALAVVAAFRLDGTALWVTLVSGGGQYGMIVSDLDCDGQPEVVGGKMTLDSAGGVLWTIPWAGTPLERDGDNFMEVADLDLDGSKEVIAGAVAYRSDGSLLWQHRDPSSSAFVAPVLEPRYHAIGKARLGSTPDVYAVVHRSTASESDVYLLDGATGGVVWGPVTFADSRFPGRPAVADLDGDNEADVVMVLEGIGAIFPGRVVAVSSKGATLWEHNLGFGTSGSSGVTLFDFAGDGTPEVLVRWRKDAFVLDGSSGVLLSSAPSIITPTLAYITVADLDKNGRADIMVPMGQSIGLDANCGIVTYTNPTWWGAPAIWLDADYHINDATVAGEIPGEEPLSWCDHNTWRAQRAIAPRLADATVSNLRASLATCPDVTLTARVGSAGGKPIPPGANVTFYDGDPALGGPPLGSVITTRTLITGTFEDVSLTVTNPLAGIGSLFAEVNTLAIECDTANACGALSVPPCGSTCTPSANAAAVSGCMGMPVTLDATGSAVAGCALPPEYRFRMGVTVLRDWITDPTYVWTTPIAGLYEVDVRCPSDTACLGSASSIVGLDPDVIPSDLENTLRSIRSSANVEMSWASVANARTYNLYRGTVKGVWPAPLLTGLNVITETLPDALGPPDSYFYRVTGASCSGMEGP